MEIRERKRCSDKGMTLLEILVAICLFAIVILPISAGLVSSLKINAKSRDVMGATDVAQSLMESFSEKTFAEIKSTMEGMGTADKLRSNGDVGFSTIDDEHYNKAGNTSSYSWVAVSNFVEVPDIAHCKIKNPAAGTSVTYNTVDMVADNHGLNDIWKHILRQQVTTTPDVKKIYYIEDPDGKFLYIGYTGINLKGKTYDAVISFLPTARTDSDKWYTYEIFMDVYEYKGNTSAKRLAESEMATVSIKTGIRAK